MSDPRTAPLPVSVLLGDTRAWIEAWSAQRLCAVDGASMVLPGEPPLRLSLGPGRVAPPVCWATIDDERLGLALRVDRPGWIGEGLSLGGSTRWLDVVVLDRVTPLLDWIERATGLRCEAPRVGFGARDARPHPHALSLRIGRGDEVATLGLSLRDVGDHVALVRAFIASVAAERDDARPDGGDRDDGPATGDVGRAPGSVVDAPAVVAWLVEAHAPIGERTLARTGDGDGLVLDPVARPGTLRLWVACDGRWYALAAVSHGPRGWVVRGTGFDAAAADPRLVAVDPGPSQGACRHVAAAIGAVELDADGIAALRPGVSLAVEGRPDRLRVMVTPERVFGLAEMLPAGRHRIARLWSGGA